MKSAAQQTLLQRIGKALVDLKQEMAKNSVANAPPAGHSCCDLPEEELVRKRATYTVRAKQSGRKKPG